MQMARAEAKKATFMALFNLAYAKCGRYCFDLLICQPLVLDVTPLEPHALFPFIVWFKPDWHIRLAHRLGELLRNFNRHLLLNLIAEAQEGDQNDAIESDVDQDPEQTENYVEVVQSVRLSSIVICAVYMIDNCLGGVSRREKRP